MYFSFLLLLLASMIQVVACFNCQRPIFQSQACFLGFQDLKFMAIFKIAFESTLYFHTFTNIAMLALILLCVFQRCIKFRCTVLHFVLIYVCYLFHCSITAAQVYSVSSYTFTSFRYLSIKIPWLQSRFLYGLHHYVYPQRVLQQQFDFN